MSRFATLHFDHAVAAPLATLWQVWTARYGHDEYMQRHMLVFMARILREASPDAAQADRAGRLLRTLSLAALAKNI